MRAYPCSLLFLLALPSCADELAEQPRPAAPAAAVVGGADGLPVESQNPAVDGEARAAMARILVSPDKRLDRPTEVVGVLDFHTTATSEDKGFEELRAKAAALGADAVIGAEFEHGEGSEPSHLSGTAVRYR